MDDVAIAQQGTILLKCLGQYISGSVASYIHLYHKLTKIKLSILNVHKFSKVYAIDLYFRSKDVRKSEQVSL